MIYEMALSSLHFGHIFLVADDKNSALLHVRHVFSNAFAFFVASSVISFGSSFILLADTATDIYKKFCFNPALRAKKSPLSLK